MSTTIAAIGTTDAVEGYRLPKDNVLRFRPLSGERTITTECPGDWNLDDCLRAVVAANAQQMARNGQVQWIEASSPELRKMLLAHYRLDARKAKRPAGWGDQSYPKAPEPEPKKKGSGGDVATAATAVGAAFMLLHLLILFLVTRLALRTVAGRDWQARLMADPASTGSGNYAPANWMGVTEDAADPDEDDLALPGEISSGTLARKLCAYSHTNGTATYTLVAVWTFDSQKILRKIGIYTAAAGGTMVFETLLNQVADGGPGDVATITETVTL